MALQLPIVRDILYPSSGLKSEKFQHFQQGFPRVDARPIPTKRPRTPDSELDRFALTPIQEEIILKLGFQPAWTSFTLRIPDHMASSIDRLRMTWQALAAHHPLLRTAIVPSNEAPGRYQQRIVQQFLPMVPGSWDPSPTSVPCLVYGEASPNHPTLTLHYHRALIDEKSLLLIWNDFELFFNGLPFPSRIPFSTYAKAIVAREREEASVFWTGYLQRYSGRPLLESSINGHTSTRTTVDGDMSLLSQVEEFAHEHQVSMQAVFLTGWAITLSRHLQSHDVAFYTNTRDCSFDQAEYVVGPMDTTVPLRIQFSESESTLDALHRLENEKRTVSQHSYVGETFIMEQSRSKSALTSMFTVYESETPMPNVRSLENVTEITLNSATGQLSLSHDMSCSSTRAKIILEHFWEVVRQMVTRPNVQLQSLSLVSEQEKTSLLSLRPSPEKISHQLVHRMIEDQARRNGDASAVQFELSEFMSFAQLNSASNRVARSLTTMTPEGAIVPVHMDLSAQFVVSLLAILKAGCAYVILDPFQPSSRKAYMINDVNAPFYLTNRDPIEGIDVSAYRIEDLMQDGSLGADEDLNRSLNPEQPAYVIYTSGSTGVPKGVVLSHRAASTGILCAPEIPSNRSLLFYNPIFSAAQRTILSTLAQGGCLCLASRSTLQGSLPRIINEMKVTTLGITSSTISLLDPENVATLQRINLTGESLDPSVVERWANHVELRNNYGLSECTQLTWGRHLLSGDQRSSQNVGLPSDSTSAYILDPGTLSLTPYMVLGELCLEGPQIASGYLNRKDATEKAFVDSPFTPGRKLYRTGDMAVRLEDGSIEIVGRIDFQTKINGQRVEPGEISAFLRQQSSVSAAVVVAATVEEEKVLVACISPSDGSLAWPKTVSALRSATLDRLPSYMVPAYWLSMDGLPVNSNGKTDVLGLKNRIQSMTRSELIGASLDTSIVQREFSDTERVVQMAWAKVLSLQPEVITVNQSFLALGGDSLKALLVISELLSHNYLAELGDILRAESLAAAASSLTYQENASDAKDPPAPFSMMPSNADVNRVKFEDAYPATPFQEGIISAHLSAGGYVYHRVFNIKGYDVARLQQAFQIVINDNAIYRTGFMAHDTGFLQTVHSHFELPWEVVTDATPIDAYVSQNHITEMDIAQPLVRAAILDGHILVVMMHHVLFDFWSSKFLFQDVAAIYNNMTVAPRLPFNLFVQQYQQQVDETMATGFWSDYLRNASITRLTTEAMPFNTVTQTSHLNVREFSATAGVTPGALMYAVWAIILWKHTGNSNVTFAVTLSGRDTPLVGVRDLNGPTMTTVPIRIQLEPTMSLVQVVQLVQNEFWEIARFSQLGLRRALKASGQDPTLFDSMVNFLVQSDSNQDAPVLEPYGEKAIWNTGFNSFEVEELADGKFEFRLSGYLEPIRTHFVMEELALLLENVVSRSDLLLKNLDIIPTSEALFLQQMSILPRVTDARFLHMRFEAIAQEAGDRVAIEFEKARPISYQELNSRANRWARFLVQEGIGADSLVPICLPKSAEMIVMILAVLKAGGGFVPLDPDNPAERNNFIVEDVSATIALTEESLRGIFDEGDSGVKVIDVYNTNVSDYPDTNLDTAYMSPDNLAYAIYTSGSTGLPKGVLIPHGAIAAGIESISTAEGWHQDWRVLQFSNYVFDVSIGDIFCTLGSGATLCMASMESLLSDLAQVINSMRVDRLFLTPTVAKLVDPTDVPGVAGIYLAGEPVTPDLVETWTPHCTVMNCYGPTEASILAVVGYIERGGNSRIIGQPLLNCASMILEPESLKMVPYGAVGELCLIGPQLARGYLNRPEATDKAFVTRGEDRVYRTGDLSRWLRNKRVECFGRKDSQVKINGHRIELGEIESAILKMSQVQNAVVNVVETQKKMQLIAFCVVESGDTRCILPAEECVETLTTVSISLTSLPPYMVPTIWIPVGTLPLLPSGKTNRKKLLQLVEEMDSNELQQYSSGEGETEFVAPATPEEILLQSLWAGLFHKDPNEISSTSPFFAHGGDSISAINLVSRCKGAGYMLAVSDVLAFPLLYEMARRMRPVKKGSNQIASVSFAASNDTYATLAAAGVDRVDIETIYQAPPGVEDFLIRGAKDEQFWQCQTVRPLPEEVDFDLWVETTTELTARNEILRSMWLEADGAWLQVVLSQPVLDLQVIHCASEEDKQQKINHTWETVFEIGKPFVCYRLFVLPDGKRDLLLKIHHAMYDGTLLRIFDDEFKALLTKQPIPETVSFRDYVSYMAATDREKSLGFWRNLLQDNLSPFPEAKNPISSALKISTTDRKVDSFAAHCGITVPIVFQTAFSLLLCRLSGRTDVTYDNLITGRNVDMEEAQTIAGTCANFLPFRSSFTPETTIRELLKDTQSLFWTTTENGNVSLQDIYGQDRDTSASRALFLFQPFDQAPPTADIVEKNMRWMVMALSKVRMPMDYALHLEVSKTPTGYTLKFKYDPALYDDEQFANLMDGFSDILEKMMSRSRSLVRNLL